MTEFALQIKRNVTFIIKILVVLSFPLVALVGIPYFGWISVLLVVGDVSVFQFTSFVSVFVGLIIMFPCIVFELYLKSRPITRSVRFLAIIASVTCWVLSVSFPFSIIIPRDVYIPYYIPSYYTINYGPVLAITFFVVLPLITRESILHSIPNELRSKNYSLIKSLAGKKIRREKVLSGLLWFGLMFCPFLMIPIYPNQFQYMSIFYIYSPYSLYSIIEVLTPYFSMELTAMIAVGLPIVLLLSAIRFVFIRDVLRFKITRIAKSRLVSVAILGEILPAAVITLIGLIFFQQGYWPLVFPSPILPILGFAYIRLNRAIPIKDEIWDDQENRMWFEKEREPFITQPGDESIKVPIAYLLVSQVRRLLKQ